MDGSDESRERQAAMLDRRRAKVQRYTSVVRLAKIVLPVMALVILGLIFLTGRERGGIEDLLTPEEIARLGAGLRLDNPRFVGVTETGEPYSLTADAALPDGTMPEEIGLEAPRGEITLGDGRVLSGTSTSGMLVRSADRLTLTGDVVLESSDGYRFETEELAVDFGDKGATASVPVRGEGPEGWIEADAFSLATDGEKLGSAVIRFEGNVHVLFTPPPSD